LAPTEQVAQIQPAISSPSIVAVEIQTIHVRYSP